ncbi:MAG: hypothetical protein RLN75_06845 [Longimicrobiales bacterium]
MRAHAVTAVVFVAGGCASALQSAPLPILDGSWDLLATVDGVDYAGRLTFAPDGLVIWDGDRGERNVCEAQPRRGGGGVLVSCPLHMDLVPNDEGQLVATVHETRRSEAVRRRCLQWEERSARMVCSEWETTPVERVEHVPKRIILVPEEGASVRWPAGQVGNPSSF